MPTWSLFSVCQPISFAVMDSPGVYDWACKFLSSDFVPYHDLAREHFSHLTGRKIVLEGPAIEMQLGYPMRWEAGIEFPRMGSLESGDDRLSSMLVEDAPVVEDEAVDAAHNKLPTVRRAREGDKSESSTGFHKVLALYIGSWTPIRTSPALEGVDHHFMLILAASTSVPGAYERLGMANSASFLSDGFLASLSTQRVEVV